MLKLELPLSECNSNISSLYY